MVKLRPSAIEEIKRGLGARSIVLVGLMGCGKSTVGRRLARALSMRFVDADDEIVRAAGKSIPDIFADHGEAHFRDGERKVISRILKKPGQVLATGGGAFMDDETRAEIKNVAVSVWLRAELDVLMGRVSRRDTRPLLRTPDPRATMQGLIDKRYPVYAEADLTVDTGEVPHDTVVRAIIGAVSDYVVEAGAA